VCSKNAGIKANLPKHIDKARNKVAVALVEGKAISIEGGHFKKALACLNVCLVTKTTKLP